jgi:hypothetical protein
MINKTTSNPSVRDIKVSGMAAPAWHKSAAVGSANVAGINFKTTSGTKNSVPGVSVGSLAGAIGKSNRF